ncbi:pentatricopeptide repeat-containing protein At5g50390, chloroplastic-like [Lotus japonicus]|uniref:pentatricopeptide repeat-containing protein At5g50390, chloroplastic-like n=1 Tax=Lotus japonicus TaxID=34305 RepID=UPI002585DF22|nr:pentatricopeptide repeat-containing protein At5g50390, chloroplastic-like [Lotus japonicus]
MGYVVRLRSWLCVLGTKRQWTCFKFWELEGDAANVGGSTYDALVNFCVGLRSIRGIKRVFNYMISNGFEPDLYTMNRVLHMHVRCGLMLDAHKLFADMPERDAVSWMTLIGRLVDSGNYAEAFEQFLCMWEEFNDCRSRTFATMVRASFCVSSSWFWLNIVANTGLVDFYSKLGRMKHCH